MVPYKGDELAGSIVKRVRIGTIGASGTGKRPLAIYLVARVNLAIAGEVEQYLVLHEPETRWPGGVQHLFEW
jgi:hypothetical protein